MVSLQADTVVMYRVHTPFAKRVRDFVHLLILWCFAMEYDATRDSVHESYLDLLYRGLQVCLPSGSLGHLFTYA